MSNMALLLETDRVTRIGSETAYATQADRSRIRYDQVKRDVFLGEKLAIAMPSIPDDSAILSIGITSEIVEKKKGNKEQLDAKNIAVVAIDQADDTTQIPDDTFEVAMGNIVSEYDLGQTLGELRRVVKPHGEIYINFYRGLDQNCLFETQIEIDDKITMAGFMVQGNNRENWSGRTWWQISAINMPKDEPSAGIQRTPRRDPIEYGEIYRAE